MSQVYYISMSQIQHVFYFVCSHDSSRNILWSYVGDDCIIKMLTELNQLSEECINEMKKNEEIEMDEDDYVDFVMLKFVIFVIRNSIRKISKLEIMIIQQENIGVQLIKNVI